MISKRAALATLVVIAAAAPAPAAVIISTAATQNMTCSSGTCVPAAKKAVLNASDLENYLSQFGNVRVMTTGNGVEANNIVVKAAFSSPDSTSLTLDAHKAITINAAVSVGSGTAELELQSDKGDEPGILSFGRKGHVTFGSLSDIFGINGGIFTLVGSVQGLASAVAANPSGAFALANDYDASGDGTYTDDPVYTTLEGTIQGLGNTISNLSIHVRDKWVAFINEVAASGVVENLRLTDIRYQDYAGDDLQVYVSGLVFTNGGYLFGNNVSGKINTGHPCCGKYAFAGGLVYSNNGSIISCSTNVSIAPNAGAGGLTVYNGGTVSVSNARGPVSANGPSVAGGLVAFNYGTISQSFATGAVTGAYAGGLTGQTSGPIDNSYSTGSVQGVSSSGGFANAVENSDAMLSTDYSTGEVPSGGGGFICSGAGEMNDDYWDTTSSGTTNGTCSGNISGVTGLSTEQLQSGLPDGFDPKIWAEDPNINNGLPYLLANLPPK